MENTDAALDFEGQMGACDSQPIKLPNGFVDDDGNWVRYVELRELTGVEEDILTDKQLARTGKSIAQVLKNTVQAFHTSDRATVYEKAQATKFVDRLTLSDSTYLNIRLRQISLGDEWRYKHKCPRENCEYEGNYVIDLRAQPATFRDDEPPQPTYEMTLPSGRTAVYRLASVRDYPALLTAKRESPDKLQTMTLQLCTVKIDDVDTAGPAGVKLLRGLTGRDRSAIREAVELKDNGVDALVDNECPKCSRTFKIALPMADDSFFFPSGARK